MNIQSFNQPTKLIKTSYKVLLQDSRQSALKVRCEEAQDARVFNSTAASSSLKALQHTKKIKENQLQEQRQSIRTLIIAIEEVKGS